MRTLIITLLFAIFLCDSDDLAAQTGETPATLEGVAAVTAEQARDIIAKGTKTFDVRKKAAFVEGHAPGAISVGSAYDKAQNRFDASVFGAAKDAPILIYGHGSDGWTAVHAARAAVAAGFTKIYWLRGGWVEWTSKNMPTE